MTAFRVVVVGAGGISGAWFPPLKKEGVSVAAVVDLRPEAARAAIEKHQLAAEASGDLKAMLRKHRPDFVVDLSVPESHCAVTCAALKAGTHVIGEKPMAPTLAEARRMVRTAERTERLYMVDQSRRWDARHECIQRAVASGAIGPLTAINCDFYLGAHFGGFRDEMPSPLILDMAIHHFDLARMLTGADATSVYAKEFTPAGSWYKGDAAASCIFEMSRIAGVPPARGTSTDQEHEQDARATQGRDALATSGQAYPVIFTYRGSWCSEGCHTSWNGNWRLVGTRGTLLYENDKDPAGQAVAGEEGFHRPLKDITPPCPPLEFPTMHGALREMLEFLRTGRRPQTECHDNIKSLAMVLAAVASARQGRRVPVRA